LAREARRQFRSKKVRISSNKRTMILIIKSILTGATVGLIFGLLKLPIPAPSALAGVLGVAGIYIGFVIAKLIIK